jgi:hypothetical protein
MEDVPEARFGRMHPETGYVRMFGNPQGGAARRKMCRMYVVIPSL